MLGFIVLTTSVNILLVVGSLCFGLATNSHFFLICTCMTAQILFSEKRIWRISTIMFAVVAFFSLLFYLKGDKSFTHISPETFEVLKFYGYFNYLILFIFIIMFFSSFVKQNHLFQEKLSNQNIILEQKNGQITDSIEYAKHIQQATLPPLSKVRSHLKESFVFFKPKDIVAGDFYWMNPFNDGSLLFATADSTGHGVPGAMVSVICTNALNRSVKEFDLTDPGAILDKTRELIIDCFEKSEDVKDGMDISLCYIDKDKRILKWAGANNPLWVIRAATGEVMTIKPDKQTVGKTENPKPFTTHTLQLEEGDCFYMFTDGYADQFGGPKGKKFKYKTLREILFETSKLSLKEQSNIINHKFEEWKGNLEQVDDVCIVGIRV
jgi:serine phosphatase RsbU (regulator of sigma subunit)